ncbi:hypothetical protein QFZ27_007494 [Inquilinus ginsengisoli]
MFRGSRCRWRNPRYRYRRSWHCPYPAACCGRNPADDGDVDAEFCHLVGKSHGQTLDGELARAIGCGVHLSDATGHGADVDDVAGTLLAHHRQSRVQDVDDAVEVRRELPFEIRCRKGLEVTENGDAGVVDHDVEPPEPGYRVTDRLFGLSLVGDIQLNQRQPLVLDTGKGAARSLSMFRPVATTLPPESRTVATMPAPIPLFAPVTNHTLLIDCSSAG